MNIFLTLAFLFFIGATVGWVLELLFRRFISSSNPQRKWVNPGFCVGPYLPLYGFGLCVLFLAARLDRLNLITNPLLQKIVMIIFMALCMTAVEYIAGILSLKLTNVRLWDYSKEWGNIKGIICPKFTLIWAILAAVYYLLLHPYILNAVDWLSDNLAFSFFIGLFFGVFIIDVVYSSRLIIKIKKFADDNDVVVKLESLRTDLRNLHEKNAQKVHFLFSFKSERPLAEQLKDVIDLLEKRNEKRKNKNK